MAAKWAGMVCDSSDEDDINTACAWASITKTDCDATSTAAGWASVTDEPSHAVNWAQLSHDDVEIDEHAIEASETAIQHQPASEIYKECALAISKVDGTTTLAELRRNTRNITTLANLATAPIDIGNVALLYDSLLQKVADHGKQEGMLENTFESEALCSFVTEQLATTAEGESRSIESKSAESKRLGCTRRLTDASRELMSVGVWALQRACANAFLEDLCDRVEKVHGAPALYIEKHRGDETPFTRVSASDLVDIDPDAMLEDVTKRQTDIAIPGDKIAATEKNPRQQKPSFK